jgi:uncharacterized protein
MRIYLPEVRMKNGEAVKYSFEEDLSSSFDDFPEGGTLKLQIAVSYSGDNVIISGSLEAAVETTCSRCLESFTNHFKTDFRDAFTVLKVAPVDDGPDMLAAETANSLTVTGDYLYLNEYIRQLIILAQEYSPICKPECKGICAGCGADLNQTTCRCGDDDLLIDVRLLKLKELNSGS